jgi:hypothetical protein
MEILSPEDVEKQLAKVNAENSIILINVDIIYKFCKSSREVNKIVIFERGLDVHALKTRTQQKKPMILFTAATFTVMVAL